MPDKRGCLMDNYSKYLHSAQKVYFKDVLLKTFEQAKFKILDTNWEHQQILPFHIMADVVIDNQKYVSVLEYRNHSVKGYNTKYGMFELSMMSKNAEHTNNIIYINPVTLESSYGLKDESASKFWGNLAFWAEEFKSDRYVSPKDGITIPDLRDIILSYYKKAKESS